MLFLVISTPRPDPPTSVVESRKRYWTWLAPLQANGICKAIWARVGRGAVAVFDVDSNDTLHRLMNEWADVIPVTFEVYPLVETGAARAFLKTQSGT